MDFLKNLRWVCRVCAVNMKEKCPGLASVHIFGPAGINHKLKKYFDIEVSKDDNLPKNICNLCFKRLQDAHYFARLATKTDRFLKAFIKSTKASYCESGNPSADFNKRFQTEFASFALVSEDKKSRMLLHQLHKDKSIVIKPKVHQQPTTDITTDTETRTALKSMPSCTVVTSIPEKTSNNLEEKRQNLKAALQTSKTAKSVPRIKVKSDSDLKAPQFSQISSQQKDQSSQTSSVSRRNEQPSMKVITVPQVTSMPGSVQDPMNNSQIKLGQVVKDIDLLTLILKALKWPYTNDNILIQIERLKEAPFHEVIRNQHLLQDADLMQILNTILSPILFQIPVAPPQQQVIPAFVSYKIPADLSVHLITEEVPNAPKHDPKPIQNSKPKPKKSNSPRKKTVPKPVMRSSTPIEILSDDESVQMFEVNVDPNLFFNAESESQDKFKNNVVQQKVKKNEDMLVFKLQTKYRKRNSSSKRKSDVEVAPSETLSKEPEIITPDTPPCLTATSSEPTEIIPKEIPIEAAAPVIEEKSQNIEATETPAVDSGDDDIWADFKVIESPDTSAVEIEKNIDISCVKEEPQTDQEESTKEEITANETVEEQCEPTKENNLDAKESIKETNELDQDANASNCTEEADLKEETITEENEKSQPRKRGRQKTNAKQTSSNKKPVEESGEQETKKVCRENSESKKSGRNSVTPTTAKQTPTSNKRTTRSITASQPAMSLRNSNLRRRICKQCGQSFTLLTDFLDHRKTHIEG